MRSNCEEMIGKTYHKLTVLKVSDETLKGGQTLLECICECGNTKLGMPSQLRNSKLKSCGRLYQERLVDWTALIGERFNNLILLRLAEKVNGMQQGVFLCECGNEHTCNITSVRRGTTKSCGCGNSGGRPLEKHGAEGSPAYVSWVAMKQRCNNVNNDHYHNYGGRGITYDSNWESFIRFFEDMGERPPGTSLNRRDNDGNYCKENCMWSTTSEQMRNTSRNVFITLGGVTKCKIDWERELDCKSDTSVSRITEIYNQRK